KNCRSAKPIFFIPDYSGRRFDGLLLCLGTTRRRLAEKSAEKVAFVPLWTRGLLRHELLDQEVNLCVLRAGLEVEGLRHVVVRLMVNVAPVRDVDRCAVL